MSCRQPGTSHSASSEIRLNLSMGLEMIQGELVIIIRVMPAVQVRIKLIMLGYVQGNMWPAITSRLTLLEKFRQLNQIKS